MGGVRKLPSGCRKYLLRCGFVCRWVGFVCLAECGWFDNVLWGRGAVFGGSGGMGCGGEAKRGGGAGGSEQWWGLEGWWGILSGAWIVGARRVCKENYNKRKKVWVALRDENGGFREGGGEWWVLQYSQVV